MLRAFRMLFSALAIGSAALMPVDAAAVRVYGLNLDDNLFTFDALGSENPNVITSGVFVSGLQPNERMLAIEFRESDQTLFGLGSTSRIYTIDPASGVATAINGPFSPALNGTSFGFAYDPVAEVLAVSSNTDRLFTVDPDSGLVASVSPLLHYAPGDPLAGLNPSPDLSGLAFGPVPGGGGSPVLYGIDNGMALVTVDPATGTIQIAGSPIFNPFNPVRLPHVGFDIHPTSGVGLLAGDSSQWDLRAVNLVTGAAGFIGVQAFPENFRDIAIAVPEPGTAFLAALGLGAIAAARRGA
jgi:hypothetical protein